MVRAFIKGGVWKNSEDEILKAAVQKYGKQQWARVASLLNRKTAKQCKARWHEWLDPSVRKVEWSRDEEEKLLHLAKLMPAQWKTIGPLVGRTAAQCQEHYEKLLDEAASGTKSGEQSGTDGTAEIRHQPLRVGQIDSHPETKPARPDPIDMDEDEIEMLQEARARLANTQGKKAKRKAREKMLAQAKRMADLQKRRELKQAGLISGQAKRKARKRLKGGDIDLGVEIPFHKPAPAGFHDVTSEVERSESIRAKQARRVDFHQLNEQQYRSRDEEEQKAKKREEARMRALEKSNMNYVVAQVSKANDPLNLRKRDTLSLPAPSVSDKELRTLARIEDAATKSAPVTMSQKGATAALLADYSDRSLPTPMRPQTNLSEKSKTESKQQSILREASKLRMLERGQTPLLGGENPVIEENPDENKNKSSLSETIVRPMTPGAPIPSTITRDHFGINNRLHAEHREGFADDAASLGGSTFATSTVAGSMTIRDLARVERRAAKKARRDLEEALAALPAPKFEYELEIPAIGDDMKTNENEVGVETQLEEDMADIDVKKRRRLQVESEKLYQQRSSVLKRRDLPRPVGGILDIVNQVDPLYEDQSTAEILIDKERFLLLKHDDIAFPVENQFSILGSSRLDKNLKKKKRAKLMKPMRSMTDIPKESLLEIIPERALNEAKDLIQNEYDRDMNDRRHAFFEDVKNKTHAHRMVSDELLKSCKTYFESNLLFCNDSWRDPRDDTKLLAKSLAEDFDTLKESTAVMHKRNQKLESKLALLTGGFAKRAQNTSFAILKHYHDEQNAFIEASVYNMLKKQEERGALRRMNSLRLRISQLEEDEEQLKGVYNLIHSNTKHEDTFEDNENKIGSVAQCS